MANVETWLTVSVSTMCAPLITWVTLWVLLVTSAPGIVTGSAWEMIRVSPSRVNSMPSVVTNELMPTIAVKKPLMKPTTMHPTSARITHGTWGIPATASL